MLISPKYLIQGMKDDPQFALEVEHYVNWVVLETVTDIVQYVIPGWLLLIGVGLLLA
jgi:hypothetical protein